MSYLNDRFRPIRELFSVLMTNATLFQKKRRWYLSGFDHVRSCRLASRRFASAWPCSAANAKYLAADFSFRSMP